ncbi:mucin-19-like [Mustelus asterias]
MKHFRFSIFWALILFGGLPEGRSEEIDKKKGAEKVNILLYLVGLIADDIIAGQGTNESSVKFEEVLKLFDSYFNPQKWWISKPNPDSIVNASLSNNSFGVCATWGRGAFKTFNNNFYHFTSTCYFTLTSICEATNILNINVLRKTSGQLQHIFMQIENTKVIVENGRIWIKDQVISVPYDDKVISVQPYGNSIKFSNRKHTISLLWNLKDAVSVILDAQYLGALCGLCGDIDVPEKSFNVERLIYSSQLSDPNDPCVTTISEKTECGLAFNCSKISNVFKRCTDRDTNNNYLELCQKDACSFENTEVNHLCSHFEEVAHQCAAADGEEWQNWRKSINCGTVLDDIRKTDRCITKTECPCTSNQSVYSHGQTKVDFCQICTCVSGEWDCSALSCPRMCKFEEGNHVTTFDGQTYQLMGDCSYIATFTDEWLVKIEMHPCLEGHKQICLESVSYTHAETEYLIKKNGLVRVNGNLIKLPLKQNGIKIFHQSPSYIQIATKIGLKMQLQITQIVQLYISLPNNVKGLVKGLCGNFNDKMDDDFLSSENIVEPLATAFAHSWKAARCIYEITAPPPCLSSENENYAKQYCSRLQKPNGDFAVCHSTVNYRKYYEMCLAASCICLNIDDCICSSFEAYAHECASRGISVFGWRKDICRVNCPDTKVFRYDMRACNQTCRSLMQHDFTCDVDDVQVSGCGCPEGTYLDHYGKCVDKIKCSCYIADTIIEHGHNAAIQGAICFCRSGTLSCSNTISDDFKQDCAGKIFLSCVDSENQNQCAKSCQNLNVPCPSVCVPGCICPNNEVEDQSGNCIPREQCPCLYSDNYFDPGAMIYLDCNMCTCEGGSWNCTQKECTKSCLVYGDGNYVTFDGQRWFFDTNCESIFVQSSFEGPGAFQVLIENLPCCENGVTCSRAIRIFLEDVEIRLLDGKVQNSFSNEVQCSEDLYSMHIVGFYLILEFSNGMTVIWDKHTRFSNEGLNWFSEIAIFHKNVSSQNNVEFNKTNSNYGMSPDTTVKLNAMPLHNLLKPMTWLDMLRKNNVVGLCGNYNFRTEDDQMTKSKSLVTSVKEFARSWQSPKPCCSLVTQISPCERNPYCYSWAARKCTIITGRSFKECHKMIDPEPYYSACVEEACACDMEGRFLGFCTAVAVYAEACSKAGICIDWRTPESCPIYCDYYNHGDECKWHYRPCGSTPIPKTCNNHPISKKFSTVLEGCYVKCPNSAPYLDENVMKCVPLSECTCYYNGQLMQPNEVKITSCGKCSACFCFSSEEIVTTTVPTTTPETTTITETTTTITSAVPSTTVTEEVCHGEWSPWFNQNVPSISNPDDIEALFPISQRLCSYISHIGNIQCQFVDYPEKPLSESSDSVLCSKGLGLVCKHSKSSSQKFCHDYKIRVCCESQTTTTIPSTANLTSTSTESITSGKYAIDI